MNSAANVRPAIAAVVVGAVGFLGGFFGPIELNPGSDQGPLFGLCMSGPLAVIAGAFFGQFADRRRWTHAQFAAGLLALVVVTAGWTLWASFPAPQYKGYVIDAEVIGCAPAGGYPTPVVTLRIYDKWSILEERKPWNNGNLIARRDMRDLNRPYIAETSACDPYRAGTRQLFSPTRADLKFRSMTATVHILGPVPDAFRATLRR